jgi:hypothetical protein
MKVVRLQKKIQTLCIKLLVASNLTNWLAGLADVALGV